MLFVITHNSSNAVIPIKAEVTLQIPRPKDFNKEQNDSKMRNEINGHFLLDTNIYRNLSYKLRLDLIEQKSEELREKEKKLGFRNLCSVIVATELISHLVPEDGQRNECYKALCLLDFHTEVKNENEQRLIVYPFENILTNYFLDRNYKQFDSYNAVIELMELLTKNCDIKNCDEYIHHIREIRSSQNQFRRNLKNQGEEILTARGLTWDSYEKKSLKKNKEIKQMNDERMEEYDRGDAFNRLAKGLIDEVYENKENSIPEKLGAEKVKSYLVKFQAPLQLYHHLLRKIGEAKGMGSEYDARWNTVSDMHLLFALCDERYSNTFFITDDILLLDICLTFDHRGKVGQLSNYLDFIA